MIKVDDIAFVRFNAPDLDQMEAFLADFGLIRAHRDAGTLYMKGSGPDPFLHVTHKGEASFTGVAFKARSLDDLNAFAKHYDAKIEALDGPGGGKLIRMKDPNGHNVELVAGRAQDRENSPRPLSAVNDIHNRPRRNELKRVGQGPSHVLRLGHCVLNVVDFRASEAWYKNRFGFITSDEIKLSPEFALGAFMRCDRGEEPADHHTLFLVGTGTPAFNHAAFEVADLDDLMSGHDVLKEKAYKHQWGIGRHYLGSQIFDYWKDPWGHTLEHWTDGDLLTASWGSRDSSLPELAGVQWGMKMPPDMG